MDDSGAGKKTGPLEKAEPKGSAREIERATKGGLQVSRPGLFPFFSFRYSYRSVSRSGDRTRFKASEHRLEDGRLESEEFEAETDSRAYLDLLSELQTRVLEQLSGFFRPFLPLPPKDKK